MGQKEDCIYWRRIIKTGNLEIINDYAKAFVYVDHNKLKNS